MRSGSVRWCCDFRLKMVWGLFLGWWGDEAQYSNSTVILCSVLYHLTYFIQYCQKGLILSWVARSWSTFCTCILQVTYLSPLLDLRIYLHTLHKFISTISITSLGSLNPSSRHNHYVHQKRQKQRRRKKRKNRKKLRTFELLVSKSWSSLHKFIDRLQYDEVHMYCTVL